MGFWGFGENGRYKQWLKRRYSNSTVNDAITTYDATINEYVESIIVNDVTTWNDGRYIINGNRIECISWLRI